VQGIKLSR